MMSKIKAKKHLMLLVAVPVVLWGFLFFKKNIAPQGNTNPVIEWIVIQYAPTAPGGVSITIQGYNFTAANNEVRSRGKTLVTGLDAVNRSAVGDSRIPQGSNRTGLNPEKAQIISFEFPQGVPCAMDEECPLSVVNANGTSNTISFRLHRP